MSHFQQSVQRLCTDKTFRLKLATAIFPNLSWYTDPDDLLYSSSAEWIAEQSHGHVEFSKVGAYQQFTNDSLLFGESQIELFSADGKIAAWRICAGLRVVCDNGASHSWLRSACIDKRIVVGAIDRVDLSFQCAVKRLSRSGVNAIAVGEYGGLKNQFLQYCHSRRIFPFTTSDVMAIATPKIKKFNQDKLKEFFSSQISPIATNYRPPSVPVCPY